MTIKLYHLVLVPSTLAAAVALWFFFAPPLLGGDTSYAFVRGTSMEPLLQTGDLVLTRKEADYSVGEIAAYRNRDLGRVVLHRIVSRDGNLYRFKGDNNDFVDSAEATRSEILGRYWFALPGPALLLRWARAPLHTLTLALGVLLLLLVVRWVRATRLVGRRRGRSLGGRDATTPRGRPRVALALAGLAALCGLAFVLLPMLQSSGGASALRYEQRGSFSYRGAPTAHGVYATGRVTTGDPVFLRLVRELRFAFAYRFASASPHLVEGTASLGAVIDNAEGWRHVLVLQPQHRFRGDSAVSAGTLRLGQLQALIARFEGATGVTDDAYTLTVSPRIRIHATAAGVPLTDQFAPPLRFALDSLELRVVPPTTLGSGPPADPFLTTRVASLSGAGAPTHARPAGVAVVQWRWAALIAGAAALIGTLAFGVAPLRSRLAPRDDPESLFRGRLIRVASTWGISGGPPVVDVQDSHDLVELADAFERPILHDLQSGAYLVESDAFVYCYTPQALPRIAEARIDSSAATPRARATGDARA